MAFLSRTCPFHSHLDLQVPFSNLAFSPLAVTGTTSRAVAFYRVTSCKNGRAKPLRSVHTTKLQKVLPGATEDVGSPLKTVHAAEDVGSPLKTVDITEDVSSLLKTVALLSAPVVLVELFLPLAAPAFGLDVVSASQIIKSFSLADLDPAVAALLSSVLGPVFASLNFLFIIRIVMSWYPQLPVDKFPYIIAFAPTEPVLNPTRRLVPPVGGVDVSPVIWVAIMSFLNEVLLGQQGLLVLLSQQRGQM